MSGNSYQDTNTGKEYYDDDDVDCVASHAADHVGLDTSRALALLMHAYVRVAMMAGISTESSKAAFDKIWNAELANLTSHPGERH